MRNIVYGLMLVLALAACSTDQLYQAIGSPDPQGPPVRYPLDYPICFQRPGTGSVFVPLRIRVLGAYVPDPMRVMSLRKKNPLDDGCWMDYRNSLPIFPLVEMKDRSPGRAQLLDMSGRGYFSAVSYKQELLNAADIREEIEREVRVESYRKEHSARFGVGNADVVEHDNDVTINGLQWRHRLTARYRPPAANDVSGAPRRSLEEVYEHRIDDTHILRLRGVFDSMVVAEPEWIAARRALLRKLVDAIRITPVTQGEIDALLVEEARRDAIDDKCGANERCRRKAGA